MSLLVTGRLSLVTVTIDAHEETWPLKETFRISRGSRTETRVIVATISDGQNIGRGEGVPVRRYNQTSDSVLAQIETINPADNFSRESLQRLLPAGAARNALDCALWDLEAKRSGKRVWELARIPIVSEIETSFTISLDTPDKMGHAAKAHSTAPILKLKLGGDSDDLPRVERSSPSRPQMPVF